MLGVAARRVEAAMARKHPVGEHLASVPLFADLSERDRALVAEHMTPIHRDAGATLLRQGEVGRELLVVTSGTVEIVRDGEHIASRGPGEVLGEIALLSDRRRTASVVAATPVDLEVLERRELAAVLQDHPDLARALASTMERRLAELDATDGPDGRGEDARRPAAGSPPSVTGPGTSD